MSESTYLGFDLSTQQLKAVVIRSDLKLVNEAKVDFDADFGAKYGINKGVLTNPSEGEIFAPTALWLEALDLVLQRLKDSGVDFSTVKCVSGAGMQHGTVFWSRDAETLLGALDAKKTLIEQLAPEDGGKSAFSHPHSPNWQDSSTQKQCEAFDAELGDEQTLADTTGSSAHHRFSGPQIMRFREKYPKHYEATSRISLVSSFLASLLLGSIAPIDISDVCGANLWDIPAGRWNETLLTLAAGGGAHNLAALQTKLGSVPSDGGAHLGHVAPYFTQRYGFSPACAVAPFTGDNPSTILSLPLRPGDAMVSLGTSTTFLMSTAEYKPHPAYHFMNHPTTPGLYMFMLCYKNGALARERVRDALNSRSDNPSPSTNDSDPALAWDAFNLAATTTPVLNQRTASDPMNLALYFPRPEIVPATPAGEWHYTYAAATRKLTHISSSFDPSSQPHYHPSDARGIVESQMLSLRLRSAPLVSADPTTSSSTTSAVPAQPRRVYLVGGGSLNPAIARIAGEVLGGVEGVYRLEIGGNACALGAAYKAVWSVERRDAGERFEEFVGARWNEGEFVRKVDGGYRKGVWEAYGEAVEGFGRMEAEVVRALRGVGKREEEGEEQGERMKGEMGSAVTRERDD